MSIFEYDEELHFKTLRQEGYEDGQLDTLIENIFALLEDLSQLPEDVISKIKQETDMDTLRRWHKLAAKAESLEEFVGKM